MLISKYVPLVSLLAVDLKGILGAVDNTISVEAWPHGYTVRTSAMVQPRGKGQQLSLLRTYLPVHPRPG